MTKQKAKPTTRKEVTADGIIGLFMLLVCISAAYAVYVVVLGTEGTTPKLMVTPLAAWVGYMLIRKFVK